MDDRDDRDDRDDPADPAGAGSTGPDDPNAGALGEVREPPRDQALPGELKPLEHVLGRGPITDEEALGVLRRRRRVELAGSPKTLGRRSGVPATLPEARGTKKPTVFRLPPRLLARAHARAELEGVPLTAIVEELLGAYADTAPEPPEQVQRRLAARQIHRRRR